MAATLTNNVAQAAEGNGIFARIFAAIKTHQMRRAAYLVTVHELNAMSDRDLTDIGIARASIHDVARAAAYAA